MRDVKLPVYDLAYSSFVDKLELTFASGTPQLLVGLNATVHSKGKPSEIIATYKVSLDRPLDLILAYSRTTRELRWASKTSPLANVSPKFSKGAEEILKKMGVPHPVLDTYERKVESPIVWNTANTFVQLIINALPSIDIGQMAPWLTLLDPLQFNFGTRYLVVTSDRMTLSIGHCTPVDVEIEPDPNFPYQMPEPIETERSKTAVAVYLPKTRLIEFISKNVMPAIMYDTGERGGVIKWRMSGAFGLKAFSLDVTAGIQLGDPYSGDLALRGTLSASTDIALTGVARAWIDGPCGTKAGLATASIQGDGAFAADVVMTYQSPGGLGRPDYGATIEGELIVTTSELDPGVIIDAVGWPIDDIIGLLIDHLVKNEVHKLSGTVHKLGRWNMITAPDWLVDLFGTQVRLCPVVESTKGIASVIGIAGFQG
jgi:hypothetical protein